MCSGEERHTLLQHSQLLHSHLMSANIRIKERVRRIERCLLLTKSTVIDFSMLDR
jgi:hypothetical protein